MTTATQLLPCPTCASLPSCQTARQIWLLALTFQEAGAEPERITLSCPMVPPGRANSPPAATPARPGDAGGCDKGKDKESVGGGPVTALSRTENSTKDVDVAIAELSRDGLSCRAIADELATMGMDVSYRTIARHLKRMAR
jgi:hypothetical protein